ncbi:hypothetical protein GA0061101_102304 [Rhizobium lusitanum]|uniref:Uncharacterized protein n=1 Tax=Rhizobium lusitanum TaxID=293958 RepID=A0A1C3UFP0_9HYPH|nr:hypothetical protein GA0061101_102304 [Rhizobium lusitanum]
MSVWLASHAGIFVEEQRARPTWSVLFLYAFQTENRLALFLEMLQLTTARARLHTCHEDRDTLTQVSQARFPIGPVIRMARL